MIDECTEVAYNFPRPTHELSYAQALAIVKAQMPDETMTIQANVAEALMNRSRLLYPRSV